MPKGNGKAVEEKALPVQHLVGIVFEDSNSTAFRSIFQGVSAEQVLLAGTILSELGKRMLNASWEKHMQEGKDE